MDFAFLQKKYHLKKDYKFANIYLRNFSEFNTSFEKSLPSSHLSQKKFLSIEIINPILKLRVNECGLTFSDCLKLALLLNSSLIAEANIAGVHIMIDPPWYPFEYDFINGKGTDTSKILFETIFNNPAFEVFGLHLKCKYKVYDNRNAVNLTEKEAQIFSDILIKKDNSNIKNLSLEFEGVEGALGITEYVCLELVYGLMKSKIENLIFKITGNLKNPFNWKYNKNTKLNLSLLKRMEKIHNLKLSFK